MTGRPSSGRGPRRRRLSRSAEFERVYRQGRSKANRFLVLYAFPREPGGEASDELRLGLSVSRKVGGAVERARIKRVLRDAFWSEAPGLSVAADYVVVARADVRGLDDREGMAGVRAALAELIGAMAAAKGHGDVERDAIAPPGSAPPEAPTADLGRSADQAPERGTDPERAA